MIMKGSNIINLQEYKCNNQKAESSDQEPNERESLLTTFDRLAGTVEGAKALIDSMMALYDPQTFIDLIFYHFNEEDQRMLIQLATRRCGVTYTHREAIHES